MPKIIGVVYPSSLFSYTKASKNFTAEISIVPAVLRQLFDDSLDIGFGIRSEKTGRVIYFTLVNAFKDDEGDYTHWEFEVYDARDDVAGLSVTVFND